MTANHANSHWPGTSSSLEPAALAAVGLSRRTLLVGVLAIPASAAVLASCGDGTKATEPTTGSTGATGTTDTAGTADTAGSTGSSVASPGAITHPTGADDVVFRLGFVGGFVPVGYAFTSVPTLLVSGDGRLITAGVATAIYPGPLLPALDERTISEAGIHKLLQLADTAGLLATPPDYSGEILVADAPDTLVVISANDETYTHQAPALGFEVQNESDARKALATFVERIGDLAVIGDDNLGKIAPLVADSYRIQARVLTQEELAGYDPAPTQVAWPAEVGVALAAAAECAVIPADKANTLLADATQTTFFTDAAVVYQVSAVALLPGDVC